MHIGPESLFVFLIDKLLHTPNGSWTHDLPLALELIRGGGAN